MRKHISLMVLTLAAVITTSAFAQPVQHVRDLSFASDSQTVPVVANVPGQGGTFQSYVAIFNPTSSAYSVTATLYDVAGTKRTALIPLAAGELKTYTNFLDAVFNGFIGGGAGKVSNPHTARGTPDQPLIAHNPKRTAGRAHGKN